ncbi:MAG: carbon storage regulator [Pirellulales bacterium]
MLVLSRKKSEQIRIGDNITITVLKVKGAAVQIGIDAPNHVKILRSELSFDAPSSPTVATNPPPATRDGQPIDRRESFSEAARYQDARRSALSPKSDRVTLADTLVFLG